MSAKARGGAVQSTFSKEGVEFEFSFIENELSFRDAFLQTLQDIRKNTDKDIIVCFSGGADSQLVKWGFDFLGIKHRVVHQRYLLDGAYLNWEEAEFMPEDTEYQNVDVLEYQKSKLFHDTYLKEYPINVHYSIQCDIKANPETDFLINSSSPMSIYKFDFREDKRFTFCPSIVNKLFGWKEFDYAGVMYDNGYVAYPIMDDLYKQQAREGFYFKWEFTHKTAFFQHHFPEVDVKLFPKKYQQAKFPYFSKLVLDRLGGIFQYEMDGKMYKIDSYPQRTFVSMEMEEFWDTIENGATLNFKRDWVKYGDPLITDDGGLLR